MEEDMTEIVNWLNIIFELTGYPMTLEGLRIKSLPTTIRVKKPIFVEMKIVPTIPIGTSDLRLFEPTKKHLSGREIKTVYNWRYEYSVFLKVEFDSYIIPQNETENNNFRLLDLDNPSVGSCHHCMARPLGCGWGSRPPDMEVSWEYIE